MLPLLYKGRFFAINLPLSTFIPPPYSINTASSFALSSFKSFSSAGFSLVKFTIPLFVIIKFLACILGSVTFSFPPSIVMVLFTPVFVPFIRTLFILTSPSLPTLNFCVCKSPPFSAFSFPFFTKISGE